MEDWCNPDFRTHTLNSKFTAFKFWICHWPTQPYGVSKHPVWVQALFYQITFILGADNNWIPYRFKDFLLHYLSATEEKTISQQSVGFWCREGITIVAARKTATNLQKLNLIVGKQIHYFTSVSANALGSNRKFACLKPIFFF